MEKKDPNSPLAEFRRQIDTIDDQIIALLTERIGIVRQVGEMKRTAHPGQCPIRAGREADMVRRIIKKFEGTGFSPAAAAAMWRTLIGASTSAESPLSLSVFTPEKDDTLYWLAREYFGPFLPITRQSLANRVLGDVMDGKASVGILPLPRRSDTGFWWSNLLGKDAPKIFAHIPFVHYGPPNAGPPGGLAIARLEPEATQDDRTLLVIEARQNVSQSRLQTALVKARLEASWVNIATLAPANRHHLLEVKGFVAPEHEALKTFRAELNDDVIGITFLGAYATPVVLPSEQHTETKTSFHAARPAKS